MRYALLCVFLASGVLTLSAQAQAPNDPADASQTSPPSYGNPDGQPESILSHRPWPYDRKPTTYGYRNPGGVGRVAEYYPPGNKFQNDSPKHITAQIGLGGQPGRSEQLASQQVGIARYNSLQSHIDRYGHPFGFGYGFGMGWGFGF